MEWLFFIILLILIGLIVVYSLNYGITPTPTSRKVKRHLLEVLPSDLKGKIVELGSGWGTLAFALARKFPECHIHAYEISPIPFLIAKGLSLWFAYPNLTMTREDFFKISLHDASLVVCYLYPGAMTALKKKFECELAPDTYILSHTFAVPGWSPIRSEFADDLYHTPIYLYRIPSTQ